MLEIHFLLTRSLFGDGTPRRWLRRVSLRNRIPLLCNSDGCAQRSLNVGFVGTQSREKHSAEPVQFGTPPTLSGSCNQSLCLPYWLLTLFEELSTRSPKSTPKTKLSSFCGNHRNRFRASLRTPNFEPGRTFFSSQRFQVMPFADGLRIAHSFGEFAQSLFA